MKKVFTKSLSVFLCLILLAVTFSSVASAASEGSVSVSGKGVYELFNSGATYLYGYGSGADASDTFTNNGYDIYLADYGVSEAQIGLSFKVDSRVTDRAVLTVLAFDVDEGPSADYEHDYVYLVDETDNTQVRVGMLSGMNEEWNTTSMEIDKSYFKAGHNYHFYLVDSVSGWVVWVRTVTLVIGNAFDIKASLKSSIDNSTAVISNRVKISASENADYTFEFKALNAEDGVQYGSYFEDVSVSRISSTGTYSFPLTSDAPYGEYTVYLYIKNPTTGAVVLVLQDTVNYTDKPVTLCQRIWNFFLRVLAYLGLS